MTLGYGRIKSIALLIALSLALQDTTTAFVRHRGLQSRYFISIRSNKCPLDTSFRPLSLKSSGTYGLRHLLSGHNDDRGGTPKEHGLVEKEEKNVLKSVLVLLTVPILWGTFAPCIKYMDSLDISLRPPVLLFNAVSAAVTAVVLWFSKTLQRSRLKQESLEELSQNNDAPESMQLSTAKPPFLSLKAMAGLELGLWLFLGSITQLFGLQLIMASRAAFLVQTTTVIVPLLEAALQGRKVPKKVLAACLLASVGLALMSFTGGGGGLELGVSSLIQNWKGPSTGDFALLAAAFFYSLHVVRLGYYAPKLNPLSLSEAKAQGELALSVAAVGFAAAFCGQAPVFTGYVERLSADVPALQLVAAVIMWCGAATSPYTKWAQSFGQQKVKPSEANLIYSSQPLFSLAFAALILQETLTRTESAGMALLMCGILLAN